MPPGAISGLLACGFRHVPLQVSSAVKPRQDEPLAHRRGFKVTDVSKDNCGYDIRAVKGKVEMFVEVKTTSGSYTQPFFLTRNEMKCLEANKSKYTVYRVYDFSTKPLIKALDAKQIEGMEKEVFIYLIIP